MTFKETVNITLKNINGLERRLMAGFVILVIVMFTGCGKSDSDKAREATERSVQSATFFNQQNYVRALNTINQAISLNTELNRDSALGENYILLAHCQRQLGQYDSALTAFKTSLQYFHLFGDPKLERRGRIGLAELFYALDDYSSALSLASDAAGESKVFSDAQNAYRAMIIVAKSYHKLRNFDREISALDELAQGNIQYGPEQSQYEILELLFQAHVSAGIQHDIREAFDKWRTVSSGNGDSIQTAKAFTAWGHYQELLHQQDSSLKAFSQALSLLGGREHRPLQMDVLTSLGNLSYRSQHFDNARLYYNDAQNLARQENNIILEQLLGLMLVSCDWKTGAGRSKTGSMPELEKRCADIASTCRQTSFFTGEAFALYMQGTLEWQRNDTAKAAPSFREALRLITDHVRLDDDDKTTMHHLIDVFMEGEHSGWYDPLLRISCSSQNTGEVFSLLEHENLDDMQNYFSRSALKTADTGLNSAIADISLKRTSLKLLEEDIRDELATGKHRNLERFETLKELYPMRFGELVASSGAIENNNFKWLLLSPELHLRAVRDTLPRNAALIEYAVLENEIYCIVVTKDSSYLKKTSASRQRVVSIVQEYNRLIGDPRLNYNAPMFDEASAIRRVNELSPVLYTMLVEPILPLLANVAKLYIVTPQEFGWLPFHTLRSPGSGPLINKFEISYLPSAAVLLFASKPEQSVHDVIGFGHAGRTGWDVEYELKDIRSFYDKAKMYFDTTATFAHLAGLSTDVLHLAAEFTVNTDVPDSSVIVVSDGATPDGLTGIPLGSLLAIPTTQAFVFSNITPAAGGLSRYAPMAFLANGTRTVIATMWQGERKAKKYFGEVFYTNLLGGISSGEAYHKAMTAMTKNEDFSKLYDWGLYYQFGR